MPEKPLEEGSGGFGKPRHLKKRARQRIFLAALIQTGGNLVGAAKSTGIPRDCHYDWMADDPVYQAEFARAWDKAIDTLEAEAARRAYEGVNEPVFHAGRRALDIVVDADGNIVMDNGKPKAKPAAINKKSDMLLMFLLNGNRSKKYRNRIDSRFVDDDGKDRPLSLASVEAWMQKQPGGGE